MDYKGYESNQQIAKLSIKIIKLKNIYILPHLCFAFAKEYLAIRQIFKHFAQIILNLEKTYQLHIFA